MTRARRERQIFDKVYGASNFGRVVKSENPDFLVERVAGHRPFGVEITEFYLSETNARFDHIPDYVVDLLGGGDFRHRADRKAADVVTVDITDADGNLRHKDVPGVFMKTPSPGEYARRVAERIRAKSERIARSSADTSHVNLIIQDRGSLFRGVKAEDFYQAFFSSEILTALSATCFREVFLVTHLAEGERYLRLKMLFMLAEARLLEGFMENAGLLTEETSPAYYLRVFSSYLARRVKPTVFLRGEEDQTEVMFGDTGLRIDGNRLQVLLYCDHSLPDDIVPATDGLTSVLGPRFARRMEAFRRRHAFNGGAAFELEASDGL